MQVAIKRKGPSFDKLHRECSAKPCWVRPNEAGVERAGTIEGFRVPIGSKATFCGLVEGDSMWFHYITIAERDGIANVNNNKLWDETHYGHQPIADTSCHVVIIRAMLCQA